VRLFPPSHVLFLLRWRLRSFQSPATLINHVTPLYADFFKIINSRPRFQVPSNGHFQISTGRSCTYPPVFEELTFSYGTASFPSRYDTTSFSFPPLELSVMDFVRLPASGPSLFFVHHVRGLRITAWGLGFVTICLSSAIPPFS